MAIHVIRVANTEKDVKGQEVAEEAKRIIGVPGLEKVRTAKVYRVEGTTEQEAQKLAENLFCEPINQECTLDKPLIADAPYVVEVAYKPGVMNPQKASIMKSAKDLGIDLLAADSSIEYGFYGKIDKKGIALIVEKLLINKMVERVVAQKPTTLLIKGSMGKTSVINIRNLDGENLIDLSRDKLFLNLEEMEVIQNYFRKIKRDPTDCELETLAQTWSEHCSHKTFKANLIIDGKKKAPLISRIKKEALKHNRHIVSAFVDNSGVMDFYDGWAISGKGETHNSPSAIEPYGGAMTGSGGVFRDIVGTGLGAKTIISTDIFCLANPDLSLSRLPVGCLRPDYILKRVVNGVKDYGNRMGIPTNNGSFHFHDDFRAKPTVLVGAYGILPKKQARRGKPKYRDVIVSIGGRVGRDGIHGATFSSGAMTDRTQHVNTQAVQIGNAIEEKRMFDAIHQARDKNIIRAIQDCGAGGFSSAIGEIGQDLGVNVQLKNAALKYQGLSPWEIWLSESQERMILAIPEKKLFQFKKICKKYNVEVSVLGKFENHKKLKVFFGKKIVCDLSMEFLHHGLPKRKMIATKPKNHLRGALKVTSKVAEGMHQTVRPEGLLRGGVPKNQKEWVNLLTKVLSHGNICSKEPIVRLYDHTVQGTNILQPFSGELMDGPNDAAVIRPLLNKPYGMIVSHGLNPVLNKIDPYWGSIWAATEAISNYAAVGGNYKEASIINNYIWPFPDAESLWSLDRSVDAVVDIMKTFKIPVISGKDSLSSTYRGKDGKIINIPPVLCISVFGKIPDVEKTVSSDFKKENSIICLVGKPDFESMGGSIYFDVLKTPSRWPNGLMEGERIPYVDLKNLPKVLTTIYNAIQKNQILSCHDISEGGIITAIFEMCVGGNMGADIHLGGVASQHLNLRPDHFLFNETAGCFITELENKEVAKRLFKNIPYVILGKTQKEKIITVSKNKKKLFSANLEDLKKSWQEPMRKIFA